MAVIRDVMPAFELFQPASVADALSLLDRYGSDAWIFAGGLDSFDWLKDRIRRPRYVVDLGVVRNPIVRQRYAILMEAAEAAASPQIRNQGTIGGNLSQDTRCWYYRSGWSCYRAGGNVCYADTPDSINREHAILGADRCVAVNPSDTAPALIALGASMVLRSASGERVVNAEDYFIGPGTDITRMHVLQPGELLTAIRIPGDFAGARFYFEKVRDRQVWDFALVSVASAMVTTGETIQAMRLAVNGVAARPLRLVNVEQFVAGKPRSEATAAAAGEMAIEGAQPLRFNAYKVPLLRNLVKRAIRGVEEWATS